MLRGREKLFGRWADAEKPAEQLCEREGCAEPGPFRAPKGRDGMNGYHHFCLAHVREYNKGYNYFADMDPDEAAYIQRTAPYGHRPTWPIGSRTANGRANARVRDPFGFADGRQYGPDVERAEAQEHARRYTADELKAFQTLEVEPTDDLHHVKRHYKQLVKRYHPDTNGGDRGAEERLKRINQAFSVLSAGLS